MLKQTEIKVSLCKKSGIHQPIRSVLETEVKLSNIVDQHDI